MNETSHVTSCGRDTAARVSDRAFDALEHGHARIVAELRVQLAVADVERDHARGAALEQHVAEPAGRGADVEAVDARRRRARTRRARARACGRRARRTAAARPPRAASPPRPARRASSAPARARPARAPGPARATRRARARRAPRQAASSATASYPGVLRLIAHTLGCAMITAKACDFDRKGPDQRRGDADQCRDRPGDRRAERHQHERAERVVGADP